MRPEVSGLFQKVKTRWVWLEILLLGAASAIVVVAVVPKIAIPFTRLIRLMKWTRRRFERVVHDAFARDGMLPKVATCLKHRLPRCVVVASAGRWLYHHQMMSLMHRNGHYSCEDGDDGFLTAFCFCACFLDMKSVSGRMRSFDSSS
ncbi:hypothetical protein AC1031_004605 [Aphanomyces cochlioides]|nr:hypothetical protein AC1031_004605 [Aphanomyces cochlioides]